MIFVLDTAIGLGIWIPFTIGKSTALLLVRYFSSTCPVVVESHDFSWIHHAYFKFCIYRYALFGS